jgi:gamma-glutamyltranspeptidase / glutathione hydrolase
VDVPLPGLRSADFIQARRAWMGDRAPEAGQAFRAAAGNPLPYQSDPSPSMTGPLPVARTDFDPVSPHPNTPEPGKRPRSSMAPTIARSPGGDLVAFGSPGGSTIITTVVGIAVNLIDFGLALPEAIAAPRLSQRNTGTTQVDSGFEQTAIGQALTALGQSLAPVPESVPPSG